MNIRVYKPSTFENPPKNIQKNPPFGTRISFERDLFFSKMTFSSILTCWPLGKWSGEMSNRKGWSNEKDLNISVSPSQNIG